MIDRAPRRLVPAVVLVVGSLAAFAGGQVVLNVPSAAHPTIQSAIVAAQDGDTVEVAAGVHAEAIDLLGKAITVSGDPAAPTVIDATGTGLPAVTMVGGEGAGSVLEDLELTGGTGRVPSYPQISAAVGGGLAIERGLLFGPVAIAADPPTIRRCRIHGNQADWGAGVGMIGVDAALVLEDCVIEGNPGGGVPAAAGGGLWCGGQDVVMRRCTVRDNVAFTGGAMLAALSNGLVMEDGDVAENAAPNSLLKTGHTAGIRATASWAFLQRVRIRGNVCGGEYGGLYFVGHDHTPIAAVLESCEITQNVAAGTSAGHVDGACTLLHATIAGNVDLTTSLGAFLFQPQAPCFVINSIVRDNTPVNLLTEATFNPAPITFRHSNVGGWVLPAGNVDVSPGFIDPAAGDYRLAFGSPMVDAGDSAFAAAVPLDVRRGPRVLYGGADMGAHESGHVAYHPASNGTLIDPSTGPIPLLSVSGDDGGADRQVDLALGQPWSLDLDAPDWMTPAPQFAIFGMLGVPDAGSVTALSPGLALAFPPCWLAPALEGVLFVVASTVPGLPCTPLVPAVPGDWTTGPLPGVPVPLDLAFQALLLDAVPALHVTNLVTLSIR